MTAQYVWLSFFLLKDKSNKCSHSIICKEIPHLSTHKSLLLEAELGPHRERRHEKKLRQNGGKVVHMLLKTQVGQTKLSIPCTNEV